MSSSFRTPRYLQPLSSGLPALLPLERFRYWTAIGLPLLIVYTTNFQIPNSMPMSFEQRKTVCAKESVYSFDLAKSLRLSINRRWFKVCSRLFFLRSLTIYTFRSTIAKGISKHFHQRERTERIPLEKTSSMETVPRCTSQEYKLVFQLGIEDFIRF